MEVGGFVQEDGGKAGAAPGFALVRDEDGGFENPAGKGGGGGCGKLEPCPESKFRVDLIPKFLGFSRRW